MEFENSFAVAAPIDEVWETLLDVERVAPCVPGAQVLEHSGEDNYKVGIKVKVGPVSMQYRGDIEIVERDAGEHRAVMSAKARETRGQGTANAQVTMHLVEEGEETKGTIATDMKLSGKAASMGRGVMQDVATRMVDTFSRNLETMLSGPEAPTAEEAGPSASSAAGPAPGGNGAAPTEAASAPPPPPPREAESELDVLPIAGSIARERLRDPRVIAVVVVLLVLWLRRRRRRR